VNDVDVRADWRRRGGLCPRHWRVWRSLEAPALSSAVLLRDLLEHEMRRRLVDAAAPEPGRRGLLDTLAARTRPPTAPAGEAPGGRCPACDVERRAERRYSHALARLTPHQLEGAWARGRGFVCVQHAGTLPAGALRALVIGRLEALLGDLDTFLRRSDHRFAQEPMGEVGDAWLRAIRAVGGDV